MPASTTPIFANQGKVQWATINAANVSSVLTNAQPVFTANSQNGSIVNEVRVKFAPSSGATTSATAFRLFVNNGGTPDGVANNTMIAEITIPAMTASNTASLPDYVIPMPRGGLVLPPSYRLYGAVATYSAGIFTVTGIGGDY